MKPYTSICQIQTMGHWIMTFFMGSGLIRIWVIFNQESIKFDCDDFAVCMKGEVSKYSYNQTRPTDMGSLCGIMWGRNGTIDHAFNFTIDPFLNLILFEPRNGQQIDHDEYVPYLCVV